MWRGLDTFTEATGMEPSSVPSWSAAAGLLQRRGAEVQRPASDSDQETLEARNGYAYGWIGTPIHEQISKIKDPEGRGS